MAADAARRVAIRIVEIYPGKTERHGLIGPCRSVSRGIVEAETGIEPVYRALQALA